MDEIVLSLSILTRKINNIKLPTSLQAIDNTLKMIGVIDILELYIKSINKIMYPFIKYNRKYMNYDGCVICSKKYNSKIIFHNYPNNENEYIVSSGCDVDERFLICEKCNEKIIKISKIMEYINNIVKFVFIEKYKWEYDVYTDTVCCSIILDYYDDYDEPIEYDKTFILSEVLSIIKSENMQLPVFLNSIK